MMIQIYSEYSLLLGFLEYQERNVAEGCRLKLLVTQIANVINLILTFSSAGSMISHHSSVMSY